MLLRFPRWPRWHCRYLVGTWTSSSTLFLSASAPLSSITLTSDKVDDYEDIFVNILFVYKIKERNLQTTKEKRSWSNDINIFPVLLRGQWQSKKWIARRKKNIILFVNKFMFSEKCINLIKFMLRWSIESKSIWLLQSVALCKEEEFHVSAGPPHNKKPTTQYNLSCSHWQG